MTLLAGCSSLPEQNGRAGVDALVKERGRAAPASDDRRAAQMLLAQVLGGPLRATDAVRLALVNNPRLKATYAQLGLAAADVYDAGRLSNPTLSASVLFPNVSGESAQVGLGLAQNFTDLLLLSRRSRLAEAEFARVQQSVGAAVLDLAADTEAAYFRLVGAAQISVLREAVGKAARVSADLAQRFFDAGNITRLQLTLEQAAASQAELDRLDAAAAVTAARAELNVLMGLGQKDDRWQIAPRLPVPLAQEDDLAGLTQMADSSRLDLAAARGSVKLLAGAFGLTRSFRYLGDVEVGVETERETDGTRLTGPTLGIELPIFNQGEGRAARAAAQLQQAEAELQVLEIEISNGLRSAHTEVANARARVEQYRRALIPLREAVVARTQEQVNFMLVGQFELLLAKQQEYDAYQGYLEAVRDYWIARTELARMVGRQLPSSAQVTDEVLDAEELTRPKDTGMQHMDHGGMNDAKPEKDMDHSGHDAPSAAPARKDPHAGHGNAKPAQPKKTPSPESPARKDGHSEMPTGMESHIPAPADDKAPKPKQPDSHDTHEHGEHQ
jgi:outer membrane protein, heavy metal efflux system